MIMLIFYSTRRCSFFPSFLPLQLPTPRQIATSPPPTCWGAAGWQGIDWVSSREQGMGDSRRTCVSSPLVCFFFFLSFFLLLIIITFSTEAVTTTLPLPTHWGSSGNHSERLPGLGTGDGGRGLETQMRLECLVRFFSCSFFLLLIIVLTSSSLVWEPPLSLANAMWGSFFCVFNFILRRTAAASKKKTIAHLHGP
jgi:hypothetical protein